MYYLRRCHFPSSSHIVRSHGGQGYGAAAAGVLTGARSRLLLTLVGAPSAGERGLSSDRLDAFAHALAVLVALDVVG